jgi:hypothetical protein
MAGKQEPFAVLSAGLLERGLVNPEDADADGFDPCAVALASIDAVREEAEALRRSLAAQKGATTKARASAAAMPAKLRKFGPVADQLPPRDLLELIAAADFVELAFTDGHSEIRGLAPRSIEGGASAWLIGPDQRLRLKVPALLIEGGQNGTPGFVLGGYALLLDGEQVAWQARDPVTIPPGTTFEFKDDVIFG